MAGVAAIVSAVAGVASTVTAMGDKKDAKSAAAATAAEQARVKSAEDKKKAALARAKGAASGAAMGADGTTSQYINDLMKEQDAELAWIRKAGASRTKAAGSQFDQDIGAGLAQAGKGVYSAGQSFGWWG